MESSNREDWQAIGGRIGIMRRANGLSQIEFANRLCEPLWATESAEHGVCTADGTLSSPDPRLLDLRRMVREITEVFDVSAEWLLTGAGEGPADAPAPDETVVYLPITLSPEYLRDAFAQLQQLLGLNATAQETLIRDFLAFIQTEFGSSC